MKKVVHVAVGVIFNQYGQILIARRPDNAHQGGLWEFPGGKVDSGESVESALERELYEELAIHVKKIEPLIKINHHYPDKSVLLDVYKIVAFDGVARGNEGQPILWIDVKNLHDYDFPAANRAIISALKLPDTMMITGEYSTKEDFMSKLEPALQRGVSLVQLRCPTIKDDEFQMLAEEAKKKCAAYEACLIANTHLENFKRIHADGLHFNRHELMRCHARPVGKNILFGASCHNELEVAHARRIDVDYVCISPVAITASHPRVDALGWEKFAELAQLSAVPAFALGGMKGNDVVLARQHHGHGVAAIREFWRS